MTDRNVDTTAQPTLGERISSLLRSLSAFTSDAFTLVALEAQQAGRSLIIMIALGLAAAFMMAIGWLLIVAWLVIVASAYISLALALFIAAAIHIVIGTILAMCIRQYTDSLTFKATRRQLLGMPKKVNLTGKNYE